LFSRDFHIILHHSISVDTSSGHQSDIPDVDAPSRSSFKYKSSHPKDLTIGNKKDPKKSRYEFSNESYMLRLLSMVEPTKVDEALSD